MLEILKFVVIDPHSLSVSSSLTSLLGGEMTLNLLYNPWCTAFHTLHVGETLLFFERGVEAFALVTPDIFFNIFSYDSNEMFGLIWADQYHLLRRTNGSLATQLGHEEFEHMAMLSTDGFDLLIEVDPGGFDGSLCDLWLDELGLHLSFSTSASCLADFNYALKEINVLEFFVAWNIVEINSVLGRLPFFFLFIFLGFFGLAKFTSLIELGLLFLLLFLFIFLFLFRLWECCKINNIIIFIVWCFGFLCLWSNLDLLIVLLILLLFLILFVLLFLIFLLLFDFVFGFVFLFFIWGLFLCLFVFLLLFIFFFFLKVDVADIFLTLLLLFFFFFWHYYFYFNYYT